MHPTAGVANITPLITNGAQALKKTSRNARPPANASGQARSATTGCTRIIVVRRPRDPSFGLSARQFVELPARFEQDWHVGIGVLPAGEKRLVRGAAAYDVAGQGERAP